MYHVRPRDILQLRHSEGRQSVSTCRQCCTRRQFQGPNYNRKQKQIPFSTFSTLGHRIFADVHQRQKRWKLTHLPQLRNYEGRQLVSVCRVLNEKVKIVPKGQTTTEKLQQVYCEVLSIGKDRDHIEILFVNNKSQLSKCSD